MRALEFWNFSETGHSLQGPCSPICRWPRHVLGWHQWCMQITACTTSWSSWDEVDQQYSGRAALSRFTLCQSVGLAADFLALVGLLALAACCHRYRCHHLIGSAEVIKSIYASLKHADINSVTQRQKIGAGGQQSNSKAKTQTPSFPSRNVKLFLRLDLLLMIFIPRHIKKVAGSVCVCVGVCYSRGNLLHGELTELMAWGRNFEDGEAGREMEPDTFWLVSFPHLTASSFVTDGSAGKVRYVCVCVRVRVWSWMWGLLPLWEAQRQR